MVYLRTYLLRVIPSSICSHPIIKKSDALVSASQTVSYFFLDAHTSWYQIRRQFPYQISPPRPALVIQHPESSEAMNNAADEDVSYSEQDAFYCIAYHAHFPHSPKPRVLK